MNHQSAIAQIREFISQNNLNAFLVSYTDEYLNEYVPLTCNSRYSLTGFTGSTGDALVTAEKVYLFVDGRYHQQADNEVDKSLVSVVKLDLQTTQREAITDILKQIQEPEVRLGVVSSKLSYQAYNKMTEDFDNLNIIEFEQDPLGSFSQVSNNNWDLWQVPLEISGVSADEKHAKLLENLEECDYFLVTKLEEIAYLSNLRGNEIPFNSSFKAKALISSDKCTIFADIEKIKSLKNLEGMSKYDFKPQSGFKEKIEQIKKENIVCICESSISLSDYRAVEKTGCVIKNLEKSPLSLMKSVKTLSELEHMKDCFLKTDIVMSRIKTWINQEFEKGELISEKDISEGVKRFFEQEGACALSFEPITSVGKNTSIIHYSHPDSDKIVKKGDFILIDCGGYFEGGYATDITRTFLAGADAQATEEQKKVYTTVLKAFLHGLNYPVAEVISGFDIDIAVRGVIDAHPIEGFSFAHGTGHGVGISVHEMPPRISFAQVAKEPLKEGMCFTIEPGFYNESWGGVRLENTVYLSRKDGQFEIKSFAKSNFDAKLVDYSLLSEKEQKWFEDYQKRAIS